MASEVQGTEVIKGYHAHVYYDANSKPAAAKLRTEIEARFNITMGRWHDAPVGPHPMGSYQVGFEPAQFSVLLPWLAMNRGKLTIFVHPLTGDVLREHTENAIWLGQTQLLNMPALERAVEKA